MGSPLVFRDIIETYELARPGYPDALFTDILAYAGDPSPKRILEIGAGPGQATAYFAERDYNLTALEISERQVGFLQNKFAAHPNFRAVCAPFEQFEPKEDAFHLIFSATAFHWIAPEVGYPKAHALLAPSGVLALFWHLASIAEPKSDVLRHLRVICREIAPEFDDYLTPAEMDSMHEARVSQMRGRRAVYEC